MRYTIVDSHIHLYPESHLPTLAWHKPGNSIGGQYSIDQYRLAARAVPIGAGKSDREPYSLRGFVYLEVDRKSSVDESNGGWKHVLEEVSFLARIINGEPVAGEGHKPEDSELCLGVVPWAPVPAGQETMQRYMALVREHMGTEKAWRKVRGVRYLLQDKQAGTGLRDGFVESLRWLGREKLVFDLGVDARQGGLHQLREAVELCRRVYDGVKDDEKVVIVINHMCKPNHRIPYNGRESIIWHPEYNEWKQYVSAMAAAGPTTYMKLSGQLTELPPLPAEPEPDFDSLAERLEPWTDVIFDAFGPSRVMFGSDWPVCNTGGGGQSAWERWRQVVQRVLDRRGLTEEEKQGVWGKVAVTAYGLDADI